MSRVGKFFIIFSLISFVLPSVVFAKPDSVSVAGKRLWIVGKAAGYGLAGGLIVGLASQVVKQKTRNIFIAGSLGMYFGIAMGIYVISSYRDPGVYEGPDTYEDFGEYSSRFSEKTLSVAEIEKDFQKNSKNFGVNILDMQF